jgi:hypothetical protein
MMPCAEVPFTDSSAFSIISSAVCDNIIVEKMRNKNMD